MTEQNWRSRLRVALASLAGEFWASENAVMATLALLVGAGAGLGAAALVWGITFLSGSVAAIAEALSGSLGRGFIIAVPAVGGLLVGFLLQAGAKDQRGLDVSHLIAALATRSVTLSPLLALAKAAAGVITIASGGSAGREGPIVHIGAAIGVAAGRHYRLNDRRITALVAAGAAGGIAATFNAPLAGIMFALEVVMGDFALPAFGVLVVAAASAAGVARALIGDAPAFVVPTQALTSAWSLLHYPVLGLLAALAAGLFIRLLLSSEQRASAWNIPPFLKPALGGLGVGVLAYFAPQVLGMGFLPIEQALRGNMGFTMLAMLALTKMLATALTLGSGGGGGIMAPVLFIGAMLGGAYGQAAHLLTPALAAAGGGEYALAGMAALLAATMRAPITAVLLIFEMTQDYHLAPALLVATLVSVLAARLFGVPNVYTAQLQRNGIDVRVRRDVNLMQTIVTEDAMTPAAALHFVAPAMTLGDLAVQFQESGHHGFIVLDDNNELFGIVTLADLEQAMARRIAPPTVADICTRNTMTIFPDETLDDALRHFASLDIGRIPVVERRNPRRVLGMVRRSDIVRAYARALVAAPEDAEQVARERLQAAVGAELAEFVLVAGDASVGKRLHQIGLPADCVIISIHRRGRVVVPRGNTQLYSGDRVIILKVSTSVDALRAILRQGTGEQESA